MALFNFGDRHIYNFEPIQIDERLHIDGTPNQTLNTRFSTLSTLRASDKALTSSTKMP
jgi:hypothetical protein